MKKDKSAPTAECLADFFRRFGRCQAFIDFVGISSQTENTWRLHGTVTTGENLLSVRCFLHLCGYQVSELEQAIPSVFETGLCIALRCTTLVEVARRLSMPRRKDFYRYFDGVQPSIERNRILREIVVEHEKVRRGKLSDLYRRSPSGLLSNEYGESIGDRTDLITSFSKACDQVRMFGKSLLEGGRAQRDAMRMKMGSGAEPLLHCTWEVLNNLLNEKTNRK